MRVPARIREQAASDKPVALAISLSERASSFGTTSRRNHAASRSAAAPRAHARLRRCCSAVASPRFRPALSLARGSLPAAAWAVSALRAVAIARSPRPRRAFGRHSSQYRRRRLSTGSPHDAHAIGFAASASGRGAREALEAYGFDATALRGVATEKSECQQVDFVFRAVLQSVAVGCLRPTHIAAILEGRQVHTTRSLNRSQETRKRTAVRSSQLYRTFLRYLKRRARLNKS